RRSREDERAVAAEVTVFVAQLDAQLAQRGPVRRGDGRDRQDVAIRSESDERVAGHVACLALVDAAARILPIGLRADPERCRRERQALPPDDLAVLVVELDGV